MTYEKAESVLPFGDNLIAAICKGSDLIAAVQQNVFVQPGGGTKVMQMSAGFTYSWSTSAADMTGANAADPDSFMLDGEPLDPDATYKVVTVDFLQSVAMGTPRSRSAPSPGNWASTCPASPATWDSTPSSPRRRRAASPRRTERSRRRREQIRQRALHRRKIEAKALRLELRRHTRCPVKRTSARSPSASFKAKAGARMADGRWSALPRASAKRSIRTGFGAVQLYGPRIVVCVRAKISERTASPT